MKLTVNGVEIEIEGTVEVEVDGKTVKIKTREPSFQPYFVPIPFWVQPPPVPQRPYWEPQIAWTTSGTEGLSTSDMYVNPA